MADLDLVLRSRRVVTPAGVRPACVAVRGGRVIAIGTTSVRSLEAVAQLHGGEPKPHTGPVNLVIQPGYRFAVVQGLLTNFHLPKSTLMMLVSAFAGHAHIMALYRHAIEQRYRFFSYGDSMLLTRTAPASQAS